MKNKRKELVVSAIDNGTVIDHIPTNAVYQVIKMLGVENYNDEVLIGNYLDSKKLEKKGIIKIKNKFFEKGEINKIALVAPTASLIVIKDYEVVEKIKTEIPDEITDILKCYNPNCITNHQVIPTCFNIVNKDEVTVQCHYCEKTMKKELFRFQD